jgi:hypothetical protein
MFDRVARFGKLSIAIDLAWLPDGAFVKEVRGTSCPLDGVSTVS